MNCFRVKAQLTLIIINYNFFCTWWFYLVSFFYLVGVLVILTVINFKFKTFFYREWWKGEQNIQKKNWKISGLLPRQSDLLFFHNFIRKNYRLMDRNDESYSFFHWAHKILYFISLSFSSEKKNYSHFHFQNYSLHSQSYKPRNKSHLLWCRLLTHKSTQYLDRRDRFSRLQHQENFYSMALNSVGWVENWKHNFFCFQISYTSWLIYCLCFRNRMVSHKSFAKWSKKKNPSQLLSQLMEKL